jgi:hypothetical protein
LKAAGLTCVLVILVSACSVGAPASPGASTATVLPPATSAPLGSQGPLPGADELCRLLTPTDWTSAGLQGAAQPSADTDGPGTAYCTYTGQAGADGGLELDAFVDTTVADAQDTFNTMSDEMSGGQQATLPGADAVLVNPSVDGIYGAIAVRDGRFSYSISMPTSYQAQTELLALAAIVLARGQAYR